MTITIKRKIEEQTLEDVFVTALEGGSNHWYFIQDKEIHKVRRLVSREDEECISIALFKAVYHHGAEIEVHSIDDEDELLGVISMHTMESRLQKLAEDDGYSWALGECIDEAGDANSSDIVFQFITLNEVIYA